MKCLYTSGKSDATHVPETCTRGTWAGTRVCRRRGAASWPAGAPRCGCDFGTRPEKQEVRDFLFTEKGINGDSVRRGGWSLAPRSES